MNVVAIAGDLKKKYLDKPISSIIDNYIQKRLTIFEKEKKELIISNGLVEQASYIISPIIVSGDAIGAVIMFSEDRILDNFDEKTVTIAAKFLGKYIEE